jgi:glycerol uptake facilitator protein
MPRLSAAVLAEFVGTLLLVLLGDGVVASVVLLGKGSDWMVITTGWALAVTLAVYVTARISGGHINPAVTLALAVKRDFPWRKVAPYVVAQVVGAFVGAALVYLVYHNAISSFEAAKQISRGTLGGPADSTPTFSIFATFPAPYFGSSMIGPLVDQIVGTAFLLVFVFALTDERNQPPKSNLAPLLVGLAVAAIGMSFGANAGYAINPARDFGPRVLAWLTGWGQVALPGVHGYFWVPIVGPLVGGVVGALVYDLFVGDVLRARGVPPAADVEARGRTVEEEPIEAPGDVERRGRTIRER